jgi:ferredoxin-NADP reductase
LRAGEPCAFAGRVTTSRSRPQRYAFIAGGIGITPILPMVAAAYLAGAEWNLIYGGRTRDSMAFRDLLSAYPGRVAVQPQDEYGLLDLAAILGLARFRGMVWAASPVPRYSVPAGSVSSRCRAGRCGVMRSSLT